MHAPSFTGLLVVAVIALGAPLLVGLFPRIRVPAVVLEIVAGIAVGPSGFGWVDVDVPIQIVSLIGLAFLLFLAGLEIDVTRLRGAVLRSAGLGYVVTLALGVAVGLAFFAVDWVQSPLLVAIALSATSLGLIVPVLKDAGQVDQPVGRLTIAGATVADFAAVLLLSLLFSETSGSTGSRLLLLGLFVVLAVLTVLALTRLQRSARLEMVLVKLQDTTAEIRVRFAVVLLVA
ncbi:MAG: cation:proton antiporter, partial [Acidimicrobiales bacterium]